MPSSTTYIVCGSCVPGGLACGPTVKERLGFTLLPTPRPSKSPQGGDSQQSRAPLPFGAVLQPRQRICAVVVPAGAIRPKATRWNSSLARTTRTSQRVPEAVCTAGPSSRSRIGSGMPLTRRMLVQRHGDVAGDLGERQAEAGDADALGGQRSRGELDARDRRPW